MSQHHTISLRVLSAMHDFLSNQTYLAQKALPDDLSFITDGIWLKDTAVIDVVTYRHGAYEVELIFAHHKNPLKFIIRGIRSCFSKEKAAGVAYYLKKEVAQDSRGTLQVSISDLQICYN